MRKIITASVIGLAVVAMAVSFYPVVKLNVISKNYGWYGSYVILPEDGSSGAVDTGSVSLATRSAEYREDGIRLTNVVYYPGLRQMAFGFVHDHAEREKYDRYSIEVADSSGRNVPGTLRVTGGERFYAKYLQKLNFRLEEPLSPQGTYTIRIVDDQGQPAGSLSVSY